MSIYLNTITEPGKRIWDNFVHWVELQPDFKIDSTVIWADAAKPYIKRYRGEFVFNRYDWLESISFRREEDLAVFKLTFS